MGILLPHYTQKAWYLSTTPSRNISVPYSSNYRPFYTYWKQSLVKKSTRPFRADAGKLTLHCTLAKLAVELTAVPSFVEPTINPGVALAKPPPRTSLVAAEPPTGVQSTGNSGFLPAVTQQA